MTGQWNYGERDHSVNSGVYEAAERLAAETQGDPRAVLAKGRPVFITAGAVAGAAAMCGVVDWAIRTMRQGRAS